MVDSGRLRFFVNIGGSLISDLESTLSMELDILIRKLSDERSKLDSVIQSLEELRQAVNESGTRLGKKRGRKFMDEQGRKEVSERMKKYWAARRAAAAGSGN